MDRQQKRGTDVLYELIAESRKYPDAIVLGRGDPDFDTPSHIVAAARDALLRRVTESSPVEGILALREAIAERVRRVNNIEADPETEIVVTNGAQEALFLMVLGVLGPKDEIIVPDPNYNTYDDAINFVGAVKISVPTFVEEDFRVDPQRVRKAITERTVAMLLVSPNNPTANVIAPDQVRQLVDIACKQDLIILADEIYDLFIYDDFVHMSPASLPQASERTLTINALSKAYAMTGWRIGWVVGPSDLIAQIKELKGAISGPTSIVSQYAALAALTGPQDDVDKMREAYARRRHIVMSALDAMGIPYGIPQGGQFIFANIGFTGMNSVDLAKRILAEQHVLVYPGAAFAKGWDDFIRITFLQPEEKLEEGMERLKLAMERILSGDR